MSIHRITLDPNHPNPDFALFMAIGEILFGIHWVDPLATCLGVTRSSITDWAQGRIAIPTARRAQLAAIYLATSPRAFARIATNHATITAALPTWTQPRPRANARPIKPTPSPRTKRPPARTLRAIDRILSAP